MELIDLERLDIAIAYVERIAEGKNPVNNLPAEEDAVLNNPNVTRCMQFIKDVLEEVKRNEKAKMKKAKNKFLPEYPLEALNHYRYQEDKPIAKFVVQLNGYMNNDLYQSLNFRPVTEWLRANGYLESVHDEKQNKTNSFPTEKGKEIGIRVEQQNRDDGSKFMQCIYNKQAQEFLVKNMATILGRNE